MQCKGRNAADHCCYVNGKPCKFLEENTEPGFRWTCGLRRQLGSWDAVITDPRYMAGANSPGRAFAKFNYSNCRDFICAACARAI